MELRATTDLTNKANETPADRSRPSLVATFAPNPPSLSK